MVCAVPECVFCDKKQLANKEHLMKKHFKDAIHFVINNEGIEYSWMHL